VETPKPVRKPTPKKKPEGNSVIKKGKGVIKKIWPF
jgi:hypothetical protein